MASTTIQTPTLPFLSQIYQGQVTSLMTSFDVPTSFSFTSGSYIELFIYNNNKNILSSEYNFTEFTILNDGQSSGNDNSVTQIDIDPEKVLNNRAYTQGEYTTYFNFFDKKIGSNLQNLFITEISSDRTEIRLDSTSLTDLDIVEQTNNFINERNNSNYFLDFYLNFGDNQLYVANNISLSDEDTENPTILIKLYEPLPSEFDLKSTLWVVTSLEDSIAYKTTFEDAPIVFIDTTSIKGPNFNLDLKDQVNNSTLSLSYEDLILTSNTSSYNQIQSLLEEKELDINVDYTDFSNFIHFSSAKTRIENFAYKVGLLEEYSSSISILDNTSNSVLTVSSSKAIFESKISNIITNFDGYEYFLYYSSGSYSWPKTTTEPPYQLASVNSNLVLNWLGSDNGASSLYGGIILSASMYDENNLNNLYFIIPEYLRNDPSNENYKLFVDMVGQHYDNIWIYYKDVTEKYNADNRLEYGISKDIVADAIRDFGVKLYQNNFSNVDLYTAFLGLTPDGALFPFPEITGSLPTPTGFEYVDTLISASNDYLPLDDINKSLYKRIYHNLPYLLKAKGTLPGLRALITSYGIPDTILRINEYGGKDKVDSNDWDYWQDEFNYAFSTVDNYITTPWDLNTDWNSPDDVPSSFTFRFKTNGLPTSNTPYSQSLWYNDFTSALTLTYTGSGYASGSYSGSVIDPYYQYATLTFYPDSANYPNSTASIYLPFFNGDWWSTMVTRNGNEFELFVGNKIYEGGDNGTLLGFFEKDKILEDSTAWIAPNQDSFFVRSNTISGNTYTELISGSLQEIRYYNTVLSESIFKDYIMNPYSIEGNLLNSGPNELAFRASLGGELYTESISIHPKVTGSWAVTNSFTGDSNFIIPNLPIFLPNTEYFFYDQPIAGIKNTVSDKIRLENDSLPSGSVLSPLRALSQTTAASASYTANINYLEVAFSPQNEINEDIMDQLGFFNMGDYIGDPAFRSSSLTSYPNLDNLRNAYFEKYTKNYDLVDFVRLIKFFDNSLFKMIKDFVPARTSLASGVVIKQHLLERNRYPQPQMEWENLDISGTLKPQWNDYNPGTVENFSGGTGGSFEIFNGTNTSPYGTDGNGPNNIFGITQSWDETYSTPLGEVTVLHDSQEEFYDGEFKGSVILVTTQSLNQPYPLENASFEYTPILYKNSFYSQSNNSTFTEGQFLNSLTTPNQGEILILASRYRVFPLPLTKGLAFVKINKIDANGIDNTIALGQLTNLLIQYTTSTTYENYGVLNISEYPNYYLYEINKEDIPLEGLGIDTEIKNYQVSASRTTPTFTLTPGNNSSIQSLTESIDNLNYFTPSTGLFTFSNTPNIPIIITASLSLNSSTNFNTGSISLIKNGDITDEFAGTTEISQTFILSSGANTVVFTGSFIPLNGDNYYLRLYNETNPSDTGNITFNSIQLRYTQSISPTASVQDSIIIEPYITQPNFYNSDQNALLNNAEDARLSTIYQDVDYSTGIVIPTNFDLLIDNEAAKAPVQDSNYTTIRHINPRYDGCKNTSQDLNKWTKGDQGTYGKLPSVELLKTYIAYSDSIGGYAPEKMNTSGVSIKYLISEDGDLIAPNTSPNSLSINQQTFVSREKVQLESLTAGGFTQNPMLNIFRGGTSIEPIIYNQIKHPDNPPMTFTQSLVFSDRNPGSTSTIGDYTATLSPNNTSTGYLISSTAFSGILNDQILASGSNVGGALSVTNAYTASAPLIAENLDLVFEVNLNCFRLLSGVGTIYARVIRGRGGVITPVSGDFGGFITDDADININFIATVPRADLQVGDTFSVAMIAGQGGNYYANNSTFKISTNPYPTPPLDVSNLWQTGSTAPYANAIYTTSSRFIQYLNSSNIYQEDIVGSGFFPITLPVTIQQGDEFRFEGDETKTFMVVRTEIVPVAPDVYFIIYLDKQISGSFVNVNEFLLRRYVDNASGLILDGLKPSSFQGPYLIKPEYISDKMEQNIGKYIEDFTNKGLL